MTRQALETEGKVVLVTGAARRIGAVIARTLHQQGMRVALHYRSSEAEADALARELNHARPHSATLIQANLQRVEELPAMIDQTVSAWGRLDALVNNASGFFPTPVGSITTAQWDALLDSNLKGPLFLSQAAASALAENGGCIVNITDIHAERPLKGYCVYSIAKAGLTMLTRALARELGPQVRVNAVAPGAILWPERELDDGDRREIVARTALKRQGTPEDIARAVLFLVRDGAYITGQTITVDGGRLLHT
ncbi:MAG: pteridine reductase [Gammaproteobacteria bacterium]|nr:pteridine reductase [Gammaproteobacteria bacterium]